MRLIRGGALSKGAKLEDLKYVSIPNPPIGLGPGVSVIAGFLVTSLCHLDVNKNML